MNRTRLTLALALCTLLAACGGGGGGSAGDAGPSDSPATDRTAPTAALDAEGLALGKTAALTVAFSETMDPSTLRLGGALGDQATILWSQRSAPNDTLTLAPRGGRWTSGAASLTLAAADLAGNALAPLARDYVVRLELPTFDSATVVVGQADFTSGASALNDHSFGGSLFGSPAIAADGRLFVGDYGNDRLLGFPSLPEVNGASANLVLGAPDFTHAGAGTRSRNALGGPQQVVFAGNRMLVAEYGNDRVVIYNSVPADSGALPDVVLGQPDFDSGISTCTAGALNSPETVSVTPDGKVIVADYGHNRVLVWNSIPTQNGTPPDLVLGQADLTHCSANDDNQDYAIDAHPTARTLSSPAGTWSDGRRLVVLDRDNSRVLVWNTFPTSNFTPADLVLGQAGMGSSEPNDDDQDGLMDAAPTARTLFQPYDGVDSNGVQLAVADTENNRVLVWNTFPTRNFQPADFVLGQGTFAGQAPNDDAQVGTQAAPTARVFSRPKGVLFHRDRLLVVDSDNSRLLVFTSR